MAVDGRRRRELLLEQLKSYAAPLTGASLARELKVSRQIIVGDIAILRAAGYDIYATPQGYLLPDKKPASAWIRATLACRHSRDKLEEELAVIIDNGGKVLDVVVEHAVYGEIKANLMLSSRRELAEFLAKITAGSDAPLSVITGGVHLHTIEVPSEEVLTVIQQELKNKGILMME